MARSRMVDGGGFHNEMYLIERALMQSARMHPDTAKFESSRLLEFLISSPWMKVLKVKGEADCVIEIRQSSRIVNGDKRLTIDVEIL